MDRPRESTGRSAQAPRSWVWSQRWSDLLFLHWQVPVAALRPRIPTPLDIDVLDGCAWVSLVLFRLRVRPRWLPFLPGLSQLIEVNLRTYVRFQDMPGIWFLSVHADNRWAIQLARLLTPMPYARADMSYLHQGNRRCFQAHRSGSSGFDLALTFEPHREEAETVECAQDAWLLERYRLFLRDPRGTLMQAEVDHPRWLVRGAKAQVTANSIGHPLGLDLSLVPDEAHYSSGVAARFGGFRVVNGAKVGEVNSTSGDGLT